MTANTQQKRAASAGGKATAAKRSGPSATAQIGNGGAQAGMAGGLSKAHLRSLGSIQKQAETLAQTTAKLLGGLGGGQQNTG